jgi:hypothetical protein
MTEAIAATARWQSCEIVEIATRTPAIKSFFLRLSETFDYTAGQHVDVQLTAPNGYTAMRSYSIASAPSEAAQGGAYSKSSNCRSALERSLGSTYRGDDLPGSGRMPCQSGVARQQAGPTGRESSRTERRIPGDGVPSRHQTAGLRPGEFVVIPGGS